MRNVGNVYRGFNTTKARKPYSYHNCGRKAWKVTPAVQTFLEQRLLALRTKMICTATILQRELASAKGITVSTRAVRKVLNDKGYKWLPRLKKRVYSAEERAARCAWARAAKKWPGGPETHLQLSLDGMTSQISS